jgi:hypothetical protein
MYNIRIINLIDIYYIREAHMIVKLILLSLLIGTVQFLDILLNINVSKIIFIHDSILILGTIAIMSIKIYKSGR